MILYLLGVFILTGVGYLRILRLMALKVYGTVASPPCRAVLLTLKTVGLNIPMTEVNIQAGDTKTPEFTKKSPQRTIPVLEDDGIVLSESRAIMEYLADKYAPDDSLLPKDLKLRAQVNSRLYFDATTLYMRHGLADLGPACQGLPRTKAVIAMLEESLSILDTLVGEESSYLVGNQLTLADIAVAVTVSDIEAVGHEIVKYKNLSRWYSNAKRVIPGFDEIAQKGANLLAGFVKPILATIPIA